MTSHLHDGHGARCGASGPTTTNPLQVTCAECVGGYSVRREHSADRCPGCGIPPDNPTRVYVGPLRGGWHQDCLAKAQDRRSA